MARYSNKNEMVDVRDALITPCGFCATRDPRKHTDACRQSWIQTYGIMNENEREMNRMVAEAEREQDIAAYEAEMRRDIALEVAAEMDRFVNVDEEDAWFEDCRHCNPCFGCSGSGKFFGHGYVENGVFKGFVGVCFRCGGKGFQTTADTKRNNYYDNNVRRVYA